MMMETEKKEKKLNERKESEYNMGHTEDVASSDRKDEQHQLNHGSIEDETAHRCCSPHSRLQTRQEKKRKNDITNPNQK